MSTPARIPEPEYDSEMQVRRVSYGGQFAWKGEDVFLSETLESEWVGLRQLDDRHWTVHFAAFPIASFDAKRLKMAPLHRGKRSRKAQD